MKGFKHYGGPPLLNQLLNYDEFYRTATHTHTHAVEDAEFVYWGDLILRS